MQSFDPSESRARTARGRRPEHDEAASRNFSKACEAGERRCSGSAKASTTRWPKPSAPRAAARSSHATREAVNAAAAQANVNIFALDPRGLIGMTTDFIDITRAGGPDYAGTDPTKPGGTPFSGTQALLGEMRLTQDSLRTLAESTGGFAAVDTNSFADAFEPHHRSQQPVLLDRIHAASPPARRTFPPHRGQGEAPGPARRSPGAATPLRAAETADERKQEALDRWARERRTGGGNDTSTELAPRSIVPCSNRG